MQTRYLFLFLALLLPGYAGLLANTFDEAAHVSIREMGKRIATLEAMLEKQGDVTRIKAPFEVIDKAGNLIMRVNNNGTFTALTLYSQQKENTVAIATGTLGSRILLISDANSALLEANNDGSHVAVTNADVRASLGSGDDGRDGLVIQTPGVAPTTQENTGANPAAGSGQMSAEISTQTGKKLALRLYDDKGMMIVSAGSNPAAAGSGTVRIANTQGETVAFMGTTLEGEHGAIGVAKAGKDVVGLFAEPRMIAVYSDSGAPLATMGKSDKSEGGNLTARSPTGDGVFSAGYNSAVGGGDACVYRAKKQSDFCLGIGVPGMGTIGR